MSYRLQERFRKVAEITNWDQFGWYHASPNAMPLGTIIVPGGEGGRARNFDEIYDSNMDYAWHDQVVWITSDLRWAMDFISGSYDGFIYRVEPLGQVHQYYRQQYYTDRARIVEVMEQWMYVEHGDPRQDVLVAKRAGFYEDMVDYKADRPLTGPEAQPISAFIPGMKTVPYASLPFMDALHEAQGTTPSTDTQVFLDARKKLFATLPLTWVPVDQIVATQETVNTKRVYQIADDPATGGGEPLFFVYWGGKYYLLNGHHRMVGFAVSGKTLMDGKVFTP